MPRSAAELKSFWRGVPLRGRVLFYLAVFFTFSIIGFVTDLLRGARTPPGSLVLVVVYSGLLAVVFGWAAIRRNWWILGAAIAASFFLSPWIAGRAAAAEAASADASRLTIAALGVAAATVLGYLFFVSFISSEGKRYLRAHGELAIAAEVHRKIVPDRSQRAAGWEWWGRSEPSGEVGGDLVDVVECPGGWAGYVVDVAGHGVGAGVLMAMAKSAARAHLASEGSAGVLLSRLNDTLIGLLASNRFATCACAVARPDGTLDLALAGHVPALVLRANRSPVETLPSPDPPLGIFAGRTFASRTIRLAPGDLLVVLTDGFTEVSGRSGEDLGLARVAEILAKQPGRSLGDLFAAVREASLRHGPQNDDQTMLLVRRLELPAEPVR